VNNGRPPRNTKLHRRSARARAKTAEEVAHGTVDRGAAVGRQLAGERSEQVQTVVRPFRGPAGDRDVGIGAIDNSHTESARNSKPPSANLASTRWASSSRRSSRTR